MDNTSVDAAFDILLKEVQIFVDDYINQILAHKRQRSRRRISRQVRRLKIWLDKFQFKIQALRQEWTDRFAADNLWNAAGPKRQQFAQNYHTAAEAFHRPVLEALVELGGRAKSAVVLQRVESKIQLNQYDKQPLPLRPPVLRWHKTLRRCRHQLVLDGLLKADSPRGIWEISEKGREMISPAKSPATNSQPPETSDSIQGASETHVGKGNVERGPNVSRIRPRLRIRPEKRGGRPRGPSLNVREEPPQRSSLGTARPELVCWKDGREWAVGVELPEELLWHGPATVIQADNILSYDESNDCYRLISLNAEVIVQLGTGGSSVITIPLQSNDLWLFKLNRRTLEFGRRVKHASGGLYLVVVPETWERDDERAGPPPICPEPVVIEGYRAHFFELTGSTTAKVAFKDRNKYPIVLNTGGPRFSLVGRAFPDSAEDVGPLFIGSPPRIAIVSGDWVEVGTIVLGQEGRGRRRWRHSFEPVPGREIQELPTEVAHRKAGWYFLRFYDRQEELIDSLDFRFVAGLRDVRFSPAGPLPSANGHVPARIEILHEPGYEFGLLPGESADIELRQDNERTLVSVPPKPEHSRIRLWVGPGADRSRKVELTLLVPRVWWAVAEESAEPARWEDQTIFVSREDLSAASSRALWLLLPAEGWTRQVKAGFEGSELRVYDVRTSTRTLRIPLRELGWVPSPGQRPEVALKVSLEHPNQTYIFTPCMLRFSLWCQQCDFKALTEKEILNHVLTTHRKSFFKHLTYQELWQRDPSLPTRILKCLYCGFYVSEKDSIYTTNAITSHLERDCKKVPLKSEKVQILFSVITDIDEIRDHVLQELPYVYRCLLCTAIVDSTSGDEILIRHLVERHKQVLYAVR
jgi:restriction system protein